MNDSVQALEARIDALESELHALRRPDGPAAVPVSDRRGVVKLLAATAVGAVGGTALKSGSAAAADGDNLVLGSEDNEATTATWLTTSDQSAIVAVSNGGYGIVTWGSAGSAWFFPSDESPLGFGADIGALWIDSAGNWWAATADGADPKWRKLAGPGTSGALHLLAEPKRVYDSRPGEPPAVDPKAPLSPQIARTVDPTANSSGVPLEARGALITLTIAGPSAPGFATVWPDGPWPGSSNINFAAGQNVAVSTVVGLSGNARFLVLANVATDVLIDVVGYYL